MELFPAEEIRSFFNFYLFSNVTSKHFYQLKSTIMKISSHSRKVSLGRLFLEAYNQTVLLKNCIKKHQERCLLE